MRYVQSRPVRWRTRDVFERFGASWAQDVVRPNKGPVELFPKSKGYVIRNEVGDGKPVKGEMWFAVKDQPMFAVAGFWRVIDDAQGFATVACDPNDLVALIHPGAMITILE